MSRALGYGSVAASVILYGVFAFPSKATATGDGVLFSLFMSSGIFLVGAIYHLIQCAATSCPSFTSLSALGGALWATSNLLTIPCCRLLGVGRTMIVWGCIEMLTGWMTARFGLFGLKPQVVTSNAMNYTGVVLGIISIIILSYAAPPSSDYKTTTLTDNKNNNNDNNSESEHQRLLQPRPPSLPVVITSKNLEGDTNDASIFAENGYDCTARLSPSRKYQFGIILCIIAGILSGSMFTPVQFAIDHAYPNASLRLSDHMFAHFTGILTAQIMYFLIYVITLRSKGLPPWASSDIGLPGFASGVLWGLAAVAWFVANENLTLVIAFPLVTLGPGIVSMAIGAAFFGEVKEGTQAILLCAAIVFFGAAATLIGLSGQ